MRRLENRLAGTEGKVSKDKGKTKSCCEMNEWRQKFFYCAVKRRRLVETEKQRLRCIQATLQSHGSKAALLIKSEPSFRKHWEGRIITASCVPKMQKFCSHDLLSLQSLQFPNIHITIPTINGQCQAGQWCQSIIQFALHCNRHSCVSSVKINRLT